MYLHVPSRKPHPSGCSRAAFNTGHIAASHHHCPADDLLSEVNKPAHTIKTYSICLSEWIPALSLSCEHVSEHESECVGSGHQGGGGLETGGEQWLLGKQLHLKRGSTQKQLGQVRPQTLIHWPTWQTTWGGTALPLRWLILVLVFVVCLPYVLNSSAL